MRVIRHITWRNGQQVVTEEPFPTISRFQARMALRQAGLFDAAAAACSAAGGDVLYAWDEALEWRRDSAAITQLGAALGLSDAQIDDLFIQAAGVAV